MNILLTGASGFVGSQIASDLINAGHQVTCCVRNVNYTKKLFPTSHVIDCDFIHDTDKTCWLPRLKDIDIVINTVGIFYHPNRDIIWKIHFETPKALFNACVEMGIKKIIQISALGVDKYEGDYSKSKLAADQYLTTLPIQNIILRPSLIHGRDSYGGTSLFRGLAGLPFIIPIPGQGHQQFQPIYLPDLSLAILNLIQNESQSKILNAVCRKKISIKDILQQLRNWLGLPNAFQLKIPNIFLKIGSFFGNFFAGSMLNSASYKMLLFDNVTDHAETNQFIQAIGFEPRDFTTGLFSQPSGVQDRWHSQLYFVKPLLQLSLAFLWLFTAFASVFLFPQDQSFALLDKVGISSDWQPLFLYGASTINALIGLCLLFNYQIRKVCLLQMFIMLIYSVIITLKLPYFWLEPFGPITKNIPLFISIYILFILENAR